MKAIFTHYLSPSDCRGPRVKASDHDGNSVTLAWLDEIDLHGNHDAAARALCAQMEWSGTLVRGSDAKAGYVYVWLDDTGTLSV